MESKEYEEFEVILDMLIENEVKKRNIPDDVAAYFLLREGINYYFRSICKRWLDTPLKDRFTS